MPQYVLRFAGVLDSASLIQDPTFTFSVSPPVGWTYPGPPPGNTGNAQRD